MQCALAQKQRQLQNQTASAIIAHKAHQQGADTMPSTLPSHVLIEIRKRMRLTRDALLNVMSTSGMRERDILSGLTILRAENRRQDIRVENMNSVLETLDMPVDALFCPTIVGQSVAHLQMLDELLFYVSFANESKPLGQKAWELLGKLKADDNFQEGINKQILISYEVVLLEAGGADPTEIRPLIHEGLRITYLEFEEDLLEWDVLIMQECPLLHRLARTYMIEGNISHALSLLQNILGNLALMPHDDKDKERMIAPILLTLVECYMKDGDYTEALAACEIGHKIAIKRNVGFYAPDFVNKKILCLHKLGKADKLPPLICQALAGFILLRRYEKIGELLQFAKIHDIAIDTHGMESVDPPMPDPICTYGKAVPCENIGDFIAGLRRKASVTLAQLSEGLCALSTLSKIESKAYPLDKVFLLEAIMQRLGRYIEYYFHTFPTREDFYNKQMRDEISSLRILNKYAEAEELLNKLAKKKGFDSNVNKQFIALSRAEIYGHKNGYSQELIDMLFDVLRITRKNFDIDLVATTRLTYYEVIALNQIANNLCGIGKPREGLRLFEDLIKNMDRYYVDEREKMRMYATILSNYSANLGRTGHHKESIDVAVKGEELCVKYRRLRNLPTLAVNRACGMLELGDKENCLPYFALAYYGSLLMERQDNANATKNHVATHLGVDFSHHQ